MTEVHGSQSPRGGTLSFCEYDVTGEFERAGLTVIFRLLTLLSDLTGTLILCPVSSGSSWSYSTGHTCHPAQGTLTCDSPCH